MDRRVREAERRYQQENSPDNLYRLFMIRMQAGDYQPDEEVISEIIDAAARAFFVNSWSDVMDEEGNLPIGVELSEAAPPTPPDAIEFAQNYIKKVEESKKLPIDEYYRFVEQLPRDPYWDRDYTPEVFGHYLSMSALGHGVGLWELVPRQYRHWVEMPYTDGYDYDEFTSRVGELSDDPEIQNQILGLVAGNIDAENYESVESWIRQAYHRPRESSLIMTALDELLEGYGVESIEDEGGEIRASYVNMGDSYVITIIFDGDYHIASYEDYITELENQDQED
jgi:hypothetical protein